MNNVAPKLSAASETHSVAMVETHYDEVKAFDRGLVVPHEVMVRSVGFG